MKQNDKYAEISFAKLGNFWLDSGLVGLAKILEDVDTNDIQIKINDNELTLTGSRNDLQSCLEKAYDHLVADYYSLSTKKQKIETTSYNFYYDTKQDEFVAFPKMKSAGIASVIFDKAASPSKDILKWKEKKGWKKEKKEISINGKKIKKTRPQLPTSHSDLQEKMEAFLDKHGLDVTTSGLLLDGPNQVRPKATIKMGTGKPKKNCYLCGEPSNVLEDAKETIFPFVTGLSGVLSFNSQGNKPEKVCWKCSLLGKFVPVNGFYLTQGKHLFAFLPYSASLEKMSEVFGTLHEAEYNDPNLYSNFKHPLGGYFQRPFEITFAFLYTLYKKLLSKQKAEQKDGNAVLDWEKMVDLTTLKAPLEFFVLHFESKGQTRMCKMAWPFRDSTYFFRLMKEVEESGVQAKEIMRLLIDFDQKKNENKTLLRNRICQRILKKQTILDLLEKHVFCSNLNYITPLSDFLKIYEPLLKRKNAMTKEEQETSVTLGKRVGVAVAKEGKKGDLFTLRKARTKIDFLEQLNRLQFKLGNKPESRFAVPPGVYEGRLTDENFMEFKQFCMISAVNSFNAAAAAATKKGE